MSVLSFFTAKGGCFLSNCLKNSYSIVGKGLHGIACIALRCPISDKLLGLFGASRCGRGSSVLFRLMILLGFAAAQMPLRAQAIVVNGYVKDAQTQQSISGATVVLHSGRFLAAAVVNDKGGYALTLPQVELIQPDVLKDSLWVEAQMLGYETQTRAVLPAKASLPKAPLNFVFLMQPKSFLMPEVNIKAYSTPAPKEWAGTYTNLNQAMLAERNLGQDMPVLLDQTPSVQVTSDAGNGVGYTGLRIRGTDATRINVTLNDVPVNDAESHQVYWVDLPDLASGTSAIQIQRGVGTSTNGTGAFGASINVQTAPFNPKPFCQTDNSFGSFNTRKHTLRFGTGALALKPDSIAQNNLYPYWGIEARLSNIVSDGYIDRAWAKLKAMQLMGVYALPKHQLRLLYIDGHEKTYQAWAGVPQEYLHTNPTFNPYTYSQQIDNYRQTHLQAQYTLDRLNGQTAAATLFYTKGKGYYEQFRPEQPLQQYGIEPDSLWLNPNMPITTGNLIPQLWLDNHFYGLTYSFKQQKNNGTINIGGSISRYNGLHFGQIIWAQYLQNDTIRTRFYEGKSQKTDANIYAKINYNLPKLPLSLFADLQYRRIQYTLKGTDENKGAYNFEPKYNFFNPKAGLSYRLDKHQNLYITYGIAHREPTRSNFIDNDTMPLPERLNNAEIGYRFENQRTAITLNAYLMQYNNQLIPTGNLNSVGAPIQQNIPKSYRAGIEISALTTIEKNWTCQANLTLSKNKIDRFVINTAVFDPDFTYLRDTALQYQNTDIAFAPQITAAATLTYTFPFRLKMAWITKYISRQYLDNTADKTRSIHPYWLNNLMCSYTIKQRVFKQLELSLLINNLFNTRYEANGWTYFLLFEQNQQPITTTNYNNYYPQARLNFLAGLRISL